MVSDASALRISRTSQLLTIGLHAPLVLSDGPMRVFTSVIEIPNLAMVDSRLNFASGRPVALQFIGDNDAGCVSQALDQFGVLGVIVVIPSMA